MRGSESASDANSQGISHARGPRRAARAIHRSSSDAMPALAQPRLELIHAREKTVVAGACSVCRVARHSLWPATQPLGALGCLALQVLRQIDIDSNGTIEWTEFQAFFSRVSDPEDRPEGGMERGRREARHAVL